MRIKPKEILNTLTEIPPAREKKKTIRAYKCDRESARASMKKITAN